MTFVIRAPTAAFSNMAAAMAGLWLTLTPTMAKGPEFLADVAAQVSDSVVAISTTKAYAAKHAKEKDDTYGGLIHRADPLPDKPFPDMPDMFKEFFKREQQEKSASASPRQHLRSGFVIDPSGVVITAYSGIADANEITVIFTDGQRLKAEVIGKDQMVDVAVLRVKTEKPLKAAKFGDSDKVRVGDWVLTAGSPLGLNGSVTASIVSALNRVLGNGPYDNYIQNNAAIATGNIGGPLFNMDGEVIGINGLIVRPEGNPVSMGFAAPANTVQPVIEQLRKFGEIRRGWLGVTIQNVDDTIAESLGLGHLRGALVTGTDDKGPAKAAGLKEGDVIVKLDGIDIKESHDLPKIVASEPAGKEVKIVVAQNGKQVTKTIRLGRLEDGVQAASGILQDMTREAERTAPQIAVGLELSRLSDELRSRYQIKDTVKSGVVITSVDPRSSAAKKLRPGEVLLEINQEAVMDPSDAVAKIKTLKDSGKKAVLIIVVNGQGETLLEALPLD